MDAFSIGSDDDQGMMSAGGTCAVKFLLNDIIINEVFIEKDR